MEKSIVCMQSGFNCYQRHEGCVCNVTFKHLWTNCVFEKLFIKSILMHSEWFLCNLCGMQ